MAIDTENKRRSITGMQHVFNVAPGADGGIVQRDRTHITLLYSGIIPDVPIDENLTIAFSSAYIHTIAFTSTNPLTITFTGLDPLNGDTFLLLEDLEALLMEDGENLLTETL